MRYWLVDDCHSEFLSDEVFFTRREALQYIKENYTEEDILAVSLRRIDVPVTAEYLRRAISGKDFAKNMVDIELTYHDFGEERSS